MLLVGAAAAQTPMPGHKHIWSFRTKSTAPALYSNRQLLKSKVFWGMHAAGFAAALVACRTRNSGEACASELPAVGALAGMDFAAMKYMSPLYGFGAPSYELQKYIRASIR